MDLKKIAKELFLQGVNAVNPQTAVQNTVKMVDGKLIIKTDTDCIEINMKDFNRIFVVGAGKATALMAKALEDILGEYITAGYINVKYGYTAKLKKIHLNEAGHPIPDNNGLEGSKAIVSLLSNTNERDLVFCLISGGGSALLPLPADNITLAEKQHITQVLLQCGADIQEINAVRKHISKIKGGQLAKLAYPATVITLILSDVVGDRLDTIASGPAVPDNTTFEEAWRVLEKYNLLDKAPKSILRRLKEGIKGKIPETPKENNKIFKKVHNIIIGSNIIALKAVEHQARKMGFNTIILTSAIEGEAREVAKVLSAIAKECVSTGNPVSPPACIISGGETTVTIKGKGKGGRNQELCLAAAIAMRGLKNVVLLSAGTDGTDGLTDAAGAIVDGTTFNKAISLGIDPLIYLKENDSYHFFNKIGDLLITGPTNTNVMDIQIILVGAHSKR